MKEYYQQRLYWIFHFSSRNFGYCLAKILCLIVGVPIYAVCFAMEMVLTAINMIFSWIPILNVVITVICKCLIVLFGSAFYLCILTDLKQYREATATQIQYEVTDVENDVARASTADNSPQTSGTDEVATSSSDESQEQTDNE